MTPASTGRRLSRAAALIFVSCLISLSAAEIVLRVVAPIADPLGPSKERPTHVPKYVPSSFTAGMSLRFVAERGLPGMTTAPIRFTTNNVGFRGGPLVMPKPPNEFRIFVVGGSTTECILLDDSTTMPQRLETRLQGIAPAGMVVRAYNAGKSGDKSFDHVAMVGQRIAHLSPDLIVVFAGLNDLKAQVKDSSYLFIPPAASDGDRWSLRDFLRFAALEFQIPRRLYILWHHRTPREQIQVIAERSNYRALVDLRERAPVSTNPPVMSLDAYRENLESLVGLAKAHRASMVLMTQATTWNAPPGDSINAWHWIGLFGDHTYAEPTLEAALERYNDVMRSVASRAGVTLVDLPRFLPKSGRYFYDDVHFNAAGADSTAAVLAGSIRAQGMLRLKESQSAGQPTPSFAPTR